MLRVFKCKECGNIIVKLVDKCDGLGCCGSFDNVIELKANTADGAKEKHVPVVTVTEKIVSVVVGSIPHPMTEEHHVAFVILETSEGFTTKILSHTGEPKATFALAEGEKPLAVYEYCNLHGLWKADI